MVYCHLRFLDTVRLLALRTSFLEFEIFLLWFVAAPIFVSFKFGFMKARVATDS